MCQGCVSTHRDPTVSVFPLCSTLGRGFGARRPGVREAEEKRSERIRAGNSKSVGSGRIYIAELNSGAPARAKRARAAEHHG